MTEPYGNSRAGAYSSNWDSCSTARSACCSASPSSAFFSRRSSAGSNGGYESWLSLGRLDQYPAGETRLATFRNPVALPSDGETADVPCWVRRIDGDRFQVFAINCAHLGCPVRWFPQSGLFLFRAMAAAACAVSANANLGFPTWRPKSTGWLSKPAKPQG